MVLSGAALLMLATVVPAAAQQRSRAVPAAEGSCKTTETDYATRTDGVKASGFKEIVPGSAVTFRQATAGCVIVTFSAESNVGPSATLRVRPLLDNKSSCQPGAPHVFWSSDDVRFFGVRSFTWICENVSAGRHKVKIQFHREGSGPAKLFFRSVTVEHN
jgi:hypothetical protein